MDAKPDQEDRTARRRGRTDALRALFESDLVGHPPLEALERILAELETDEEAAARARSLVQGVIRHRPEIDAEIARAAPAWPIEQMPAIDKNILRLAIFEILHDNRQVPSRMLVNEAVELAKDFGSDSSSRFINGVLGTITAGQGKRA